MPGAGSAGSSAAYYLRKYADEADIALNISVFERNSYVGGRSTTVHAYGDPLQPVELGASIFVEVNRNLVNAVKEFNLSTSSFSSRISTDGPELGIWDGVRFRFTEQSEDSTWWTGAKLAWRYGPLTLYRARALRNAAIGSFLKMYDEPTFPFASLSDTVYDLGLTKFTAATGEQLLKEHGIGDLFADEIVEASTRVNYAQNLNLIHGLEAMVCLSTEGAMAVEGGNWQIFDHMLKSSGATVHLSSPVRKVERLDDGRYVVHSKSSSYLSGFLNTQETFDEIILAGPRQFSGIDFQPELAHVPDEIPYVKLHVTLFTSKHLLSPLAFNLQPGDAVPQVILTTLPPDEPRSNVTDAGLPGFFSISLLRPVVDTRRFRSAQPEYLYKIFSPQAVNSTFLAHILGLKPRKANEIISQRDVSWVYRQVWDSYPYEFPRVTFEESRLDSGVWYTAGMEVFVSTMETMSLMGMNVARLVVDGWKGGMGRKE